MTMIFNALSGAQAAKAALNTNSQNVANAATPGYTRQGVQMSAQQNSPRGVNAAGSGVQVSSLQRFSDGYKNLQLWHAATTLGQREAGQSYLDQLEQVMSNDAANINHGMDGFFAALNAASVQPDSGPLREQVLASADTLVKQFDSQQQLFASQSKAIEAQRGALIKQLNGFTHDIASLNDQIASAQASGANAAALLDARDQKIDALASLVGIQVVDHPDGSKTVSLKNGQPLVAGSDAAQLRQEKGELKLRFASGEFGLPKEGVGGQLGGLLDYEQQILAPTQHAVSELAGGLASLVNGQLQSGFDANGAPGQPLFAFANGKLTMATTSAQQLAFASRPGEPGNGDNLKAMIALKGSKLQVSEFDAAGHPVKDSMGGTRTKSVVLGDVYSQVVGTLGVQSQQNQAAQTTAQTLRDQAKESWQSTSGVNSDEEAINLMQYSQLYNANLRVVASANELFDSTLEMLH